MRFRSITISFAFHIVMALLALVSMPWLKKEIKMPAPISVELVQIAKVTQTKKAAPKAKPKPKKKKKKVRKPPPAKKNNMKKAVVPVKKEPVKKEKEKSAAQEEVIKKSAPPKKKEKKKKKKEKVVAEQRDFSSVLKNLELQGKKAVPEEQAQNAPLGEKMTMREEDALRRQLEQCWNVPYGAKDAENLVVEVFMVIRPDRTLQFAEVRDKGRYNRDNFFRAAADSAIRAVKSPLCSPFSLPPDKYDVWKETTVTFNPKEMF